MLVVIEDGYVKVKRKDGRTVCAAPLPRSGRDLRDIEFTDARDQKCNRTRQAAMRALQAAGYR